MSWDDRRQAGSPRRPGREDGYTIVEDAIELELVDALAEDLLRLERRLRAVPASNI
jgi:hypothetical protein